MTSNQQFESQEGCIASGAARPCLRPAITALGAVKMKHPLFYLLLVPVAFSAAPCLAGGTLGTEELKLLMLQQPIVHNALMSSLDLAESAFAEARLGSHFVHLGGARVGPYTIKATLKQSREEIEVILCTKARFLGRDGSELPEDRLESAERIAEKLVAVMLREPSATFAGPECP